MEEIEIAAMPLGKVEINVITHPLDFGLHKGKLLGEVGDDYLNWIYIMAEERPSTFIGRNWQPEIKWEVERRNGEMRRLGGRNFIPYNRDEILQNVAVADTVFPPPVQYAKGGVIRNPLDNRSLSLEEVEAWRKVVRQEGVKPDSCGPRKKPWLPPFPPLQRDPTQPCVKMPVMGAKEEPVEGDDVDLLVDSGWNDMSVAVTNVLVDEASIALWKQFGQRVDKKVGFCRWMMDVSEEALNYGKLVKETMVHGGSRDFPPIPNDTKTYSYLGVLFEYEVNREETGKRPRLVRVL